MTYADRIPLERRPADPHHAAVEDRLHVALNDLASANRAIRELTAQLAAAHASLRSVANHCDAIEATWDGNGGQVARFARDIVRRIRAVVADEQRDRAWADHDNTQEG